METANKNATHKKQSKYNVMIKEIQNTLKDVNKLGNGKCMKNKSKLKGKFRGLQISFSIYLEMIQLFFFN